MSRRSSTTANVVQNTTLEGHSRSKRVKLLFRTVKTRSRVLVDMTSNNENVTFDEFYLIPDGNFGVKNMTFGGPGCSECQSHTKIPGCEDHMKGSSETHEKHDFDLL